MSVRQKLFIILENKVVQKLKLENNVFTIKWSPNLKFLKKNKRIRLIFNIENQLSKYDFGIF